VWWCGVVWCGVVWCGVVWCGVVWCGVVWCGVVWCGVVWCGVLGVVYCVIALCCVILGSVVGEVGASVEEKHTSTRVIIITLSDVVVDGGVASECILADSSNACIPILACQVVGRRSGTSCSRIRRSAEARLTPKTI